MYDAFSRVVGTYVLNLKHRGEMPEASHTQGNLFTAQIGRLLELSGASARSLLLVMLQIIGQPGFSSSQNGLDRLTRRLYQWVLDHFDDSSHLPGLPPPDRPAAVTVVSPLPLNRASKARCCWM